MAGLDQGKLDREAAIGDLPLPHKAGLQTTGGIPPPAPGLGQGASAPCAPHLVPARGPSSPAMGSMVYLFSSAHPNTDTVLGLAHPPYLPLLILYVLVPFYLLGRGRAQAEDIPRCPGARLPRSVPFPLAGGRLNKDRNSRIACFIKG